MRLWVITGSPQLTTSCSAIVWSCGSAKQVLTTGHWRSQHCLRACDYNPGTWQSMFVFNDGCSIWQSHNHYLRPSQPASHKQNQFRGRWQKGHKLLLMLFLLRSPAKGYKAPRILYSILCTHAHSTLPEVLRHYCGYCKHSHTSSSHPQPHRALPQLLFAI